MVWIMNERESSERDDLQIRVPLTVAEKRDFEKHMASNSFVRGGWVRQAILEKLARERRAELAVARDER